MIELRTLGSLELRSERGEDLCARLQPKRLALLVYLAHAPRRFHRRDSLMALFWPELDAAGARNSLRQALYELRRILGKGVLEGRGYEEITAVESHFWSDTVAFDAALETDDLERALDLYRGDLLEGFYVQNVAPEFEHWLETERVSLRRKAVRASAVLANREEERGELSSAVVWARLGARLDPDDECVLRRLIELLDRAGDQAGALRAFDDFSRRTREEFDVEPAEETRALIRVVRGRTQCDTQPAFPETQIDEPLTSFIGRERELASIEDLLRNSGPRLLTLTGPGGSGKSRLALRSARHLVDRFADGVVVVEMSDSRTVDGSLSRLVRVLGLQHDGRETPAATLRRQLSKRELLLVLDGLERVREVGLEIVQLLQAAPRLKVLATSRAPLKVRGEHEFPVPPLSLPAGLSATVEFPLNSEAVALFVERAESVRPDFRLTRRNVGAVSEICRRLDGLPLAIELAAARVKSLTPEAIAERLESRFSLLKGGPADLPVRHRSLETAIDWSYALLEQDERALFRGLGVFAGGFGLDLAEPLFEAIGTPALELIDGLATVVDYSLVSQREIDGKPRFEMLDTVHAYAVKRLIESGEEQEWRRRHARSVLDWIEDGERWYCSAEQGSWFKRVERDHGNVQGALLWAVEQKDSSIAVRLGAALWPYWFGAGHLVEGGTWLEQILTLEGEPERGARAKAYLGASWIASARARHEEAFEYANHSAALYRASGDEHGQLRAIEASGFVALEAGRIDHAESAFEICLERSRAFGNARRQAVALDALGQVALAKGEHEIAELHFREGASIARRMGHSTVVAQGLLSLGEVALQSGAHDRAFALHEEALDLFREAGQRINIAWTLSRLGRALVQTGRLEPGRTKLAEALPIFHDLGYVRGIAFSLYGFAAIAMARGDHRRAARLIGGTEALLERADDRLSASDEVAVAALRSSIGERLQASRDAIERSVGSRLDVDSLVALALAEEPAAARRALGRSAV